VGAGEPVALLGLAGVVIAWRARGGLRLLPLSLLLLLPMLFLVVSRAVRYGVVHVALLAALAGLALARLAEGAAERQGPGRRTADLLLAALLMLALAPSLLRGLAFDALLGGRDTRLDVQEHLRASGAEGSELVLFGLFGLRGPGFTPWSESEPLDYVRAVNRAGLMTREEAAALRPRFILHDLGSAALDPFGWHDVAEAVAREYDLVLSVDARSDPRALTLPDETAGTPGFFVPYARPWLMSRPGPPLALYERRGL
jgi:hypothetical protein